MKFYPVLLLFTICGTTLGLEELELKISPNQNNLLIKEGDHAMFTCSHESDHASDHFKLKVKGPNIEAESGDKDKGKVKNVLNVRMEIDSVQAQNNAGQYTCMLVNKTDNAVVKTKNITLTITSITEVKTKPELHIHDKLPILSEPLGCNISLSETSLRVSGPVWYQNKTSIEDIDDSRFKQEEKSGLLIIDQPSPADLGVYYAKYLISDQSDNGLDYQCKVEITALPNVNHIPDSSCKNVIEGKKVDLQCKVWGFPKPIISWFKDGQPINITQGSSKIMMKPVNGYKDAHLMIDSADFSDSGDYSCLAKAGNNSVEQVICVGVKDKHAALWPFIAIVCEVLVLCAIIFVYEKKRNDRAKQAEREALDAPSNEAKGKDVRKRRQQSS